MARRQRTTMRLDKDVRKFLEESKRKYEGLDMTEIMHFAVRHVRDEKVLENMFQSNESTGQTSDPKKKGSKGNNEGSNMDREKDPSGGVSFSDISQSKKEEESGEVQNPQRQDESGSNEDESHDETPEDDEEGEKPQSAASSFRSRFRG